MLTAQQMEKLSPMMRQYLEIKQQQPDQILFFRLGDFYEMFFEDALLVSRELELTLTGKECGLEERAPMCGVPFHSAEIYIARLVKKGYKVAICEQLENPALAKGLVKRGVIRVVTPGTLLESTLLDEGSNNFICSIFCGEDGYGVSFGDVSTGEMNVTQLELSDDQLLDELGKFSPNEILYNHKLSEQKRILTFIKEKLPSCTAGEAADEFFMPAAAQRNVLRQFQGKNLTELGLSELPMATASLGALIAYLQLTQRTGLERIQSVKLYRQEQYMHLDITCRKNLELTETMRGRERRGTLLWVLDQTKTSMGKRLMKATIERPQISPTVINRRLNAVEELTGNSMLLGELQGQMSGVYDMERLMTKIVYGSAGPRDLTALCATMQKLPRLKSLLDAVKSQALWTIYSNIDPLADVTRLIESSIEDDPPVNLKDGGVIRRGYHQELDDNRYISENTKEIILSIESRERERTGIRNLKVGYNRVFGYYIEVSRSNLELVPPDYIRKQTLTGGERFITQELKDLETKVLNAQQIILELEARLFSEIREKVAGELERIQRTASAIAKLDVLCSFASVAQENHYVRPVVDLSDEIEIIDGRHPVVEKVLSGSLFVPNDTKLDNNSNQIAVITGPNMAGKSTYMRQVALITLMAQIGSFVPAKQAHIGVVDAIHTRVGASDDLSSGQSTFMVEMSEVAHILETATSKSLLVLDEIGRGTSTFDGMSIARAVIEYIADRKHLGAKTLFATHYHELTELEEIIPSVKNYNTAVKKRGEEITFLRRIVPGGADESYGVEVSKLAGIPRWVINRAYEVLASLEEGKAPPQAKVHTKARMRDAEQISFVDENAELIKRRLRDVDVNTISPLEALNLLYEFKKLV